MEVINKDKGFGFDWLKRNRRFLAVIAYWPGTAQTQFRRKETLVELKKKTADVE